MALDKLVDGAQLDSDLASVANAIRTKGGTSAQLAFPADFVSAVNAIQTGGGGGGNEDAIISRSLSGSYSNSTATAVGDYALNSCKSMTAATFSAATTVGTQAFANCSNLVTLNLPEATSVGTYLCNSDAKLETATVPKAAQISSYAFNGCTKLATVDATAAAKIGTYGFQNCKALVSAAFPNVATVDGAAFNGCSALATVDFGKRVNFAGGTAFGNCSALTTIYATDKFVTTSVTSGNYCFDYCFKLVGGAGTTFDASNNDQALAVPYARIDGGTEKPGYFTKKQ